jgi:drug/metabolite transporter (DMT)-like permease
MLLWTAYVVCDAALSPGHGRRHVHGDVSPIAAVAVLSAGDRQWDVFGMSGTGWTYMLILTFLVGVAGHGLMVFAQKTIAIGTIGIAQVVQPALALVWSFLLLSETVRGWQVAGIAMRIGGLTAFLVLNERGNRAPRDGTPAGTDRG